MRVKGAIRSVWGVRAAGALMGVVVGVLAVMASIHRDAMHDVGLRKFCASLCRKTGAFLYVLHHLRCRADGYRGLTRLTRAECPATSGIEFRYALGRGLPMIVRPFRCTISDVFDTLR